MNLVSPCMTPSGTVLLFSCRGKLKKTEAEIPLRRSTCGLESCLMLKNAKGQTVGQKRKVFKLLLMIEVYHTTEIQTPVFISDFSQIFQ